MSNTHPLFLIVSGVGASGLPYMGRMDPAKGPQHQVNAAVERVSFRLLRKFGHARSFGRLTKVQKANFQFAQCHTKSLRKNTNLSEKNVFTFNLANPGGFFAKTVTWTLLH